jgi:hypothetical protein
MNVHQTNKRLKAIKYLGLLFVTLIFLPGCYLFALNPYFTSKDIVYDPNLVGKWVGSVGKGHLEFSNQNNKSYKMILVDEAGKIGNFNATLFRLDKILFIDIIPSDNDTAQVFPFCGNSAILYNLHFITVHTLLLVKHIDSLQFNYMSINYQWVNDNISKLTRKYNRLPDGRFILTGNTSEMQKVVRLMVKEKGVFEERPMLSRINAINK